MTSLIELIKIKKGQKIAQLIIPNIMYPKIKKVKILRDTERNNKGFGEMVMVLIFCMDLFMNVLI